MPDSALPMSMKAAVAYADTPLGALGVVDVPTPVPVPGEVLLRVHAAGINPVDVKSRNGRGAASFLSTDPHSDPFPWIPGWDVAGEIVDIGRGVAGFRPGERVFGMLNFPRSGNAYAEYAVASVAHICRTPDRLTDIEAAGLPMAASTAWQALVEAGRLQAGQRVLVTAASGGVGHLAVQIARDRGAEVLGLSSTANMDFVRSLGAEAIDRTAADWRAGVAPVDLVLDMFGGEQLETLYTVIRPGGTLVTVSSASLTSAPDGIRTQMVVVSADGRCLDAIAEAASRGAVLPHVSRVLGLDEAGLAHELIDSGRTRGKLVLDITGGTSD
ncbi:NADP-dependent oxidoreductase [Mycolicibacterium sp. 22603]|uniref:NADP-dependent oxidoreductase n=1 Tax=Mycolicibacterium sp. 22603 TaxID=3453950 RepID=UPI003F8331EE